MLYKMRCQACGHKYKYFSDRKVLIIPTNQRCPKCGKWTGEPIQDEEDRDYEWQHARDAYGGERDD